MPPVKKYPKEEIIDIAYNIARKEGMSSINARKIANILNSSVQPIFHNFTSMDDLKQAVYEKIYHKYQKYMEEGKKHSQPYKGMGLSYIKFAQDYPEFFKIIFMQETNLNAEKFILADAKGNDIIKYGQQLTHLSYEEQTKFHVQVWIFTHGLACLAATKTITLSENEISELLQTTVLEMLQGYKKLRCNITRGTSN